MINPLKYYFLVCSLSALVSCAAFQPTNNAPLDSSVLLDIKLAFELGPALQFETMVDQELETLTKTGNYQGAGDYAVAAGLMWIPKITPGIAQQEAVAKAAGLFERAVTFYDRAGLAYHEAKANMFLYTTYTRQRNMRRGCLYLPKAQVLVSEAGEHISPEDFSFHIGKFATPQALLNNLVEPCDVATYQPDRDNFDEGGQVKILKRN